MTLKVTASLEVDERYDPKGRGDLCQFDLDSDPKCHRVIRGRRDLLYDPKSQVTFVISLTQVMAQKVTVSLEVMATFVVSLNYFITPRGRRVITGL